MKDADFKPLEDRLLRDFFWLLFEPIVPILKEMAPGTELLSKLDRLRNDAQDALRSAIKTGRLQLVKGQFYGPISATLSLALRQIGAKRDKRTGNYALDPEMVPLWLRAEAEIYQMKAREAHEKIKKTLDMIADTADELIEKNHFFGFEPSKQAEESWRQAALKVGIAPELRLPAQQKLAEEYNNNLKLKVKDFTKRAVQDMRSDVEENAQAGLRFDTLVSRFERRHDISRTKAKFLARQETGLYMAKFRKAQFGEMGITHYRWSATGGKSGDGRTRDAHKDLHGRIFRYDDPPIVDPRTGRRANPGEDFGCRCTDIPQVEAMAEVA